MRSLTRVSVLMGPPSLAAVPGATSLLDPAGIRWEHTQTISKKPCTSRAQCRPIAAKAAHAARRTGIRDACDRTAEP